METSYKLITTTDELRDAVAELSKYSVIGFDTETTDLDPYKGRVRLVQLGTPEGFTYIFDLDCFASSDMRKAESLEPLRRLLAARRPIKVAHNAKFDAKWIKHYLNVELGGDYDSLTCTQIEVERGGLFDTLLASQIVSAGDTEDRHSLQMVVERYLNEPMDKSAQLSDWSGELSESQLEYAAHDAAILLPLREKLIERIKADSLGRVAQLEFECVVPIAEVELAGVFLDVACWREQIAVVQKKRTILAEQLQEMLAVGATQGLLFANARADINLDSHTQVMAALKRLGIELPDSTRNWKLQPLAAKHEQIAKLLEYRTVQKSLTSYGENIINEINPKTGRIHASFHQIGAPTGRMACTNPNVQQVPHAIEYRRCFRAPEGRKLVISDYCVAAGTRVATKGGLLPIEEVQADDKVFLEDGSFAHVSAIIKRGKLPAVTVTLKNGYSLTATSMHRIRVIDAEGRYVWRRIGELKDTDFVAIQPGRGLHDDLPYVELPQAACQHFNNHKSLRIPSCADERLATFMGYISGDGTLRRNVIGWVVNSQDRSVFRTINDLASELFGIPVHHRGEYRGVCEAGLYSVPLAKWCLAVGLSKSRVPEFLWKSKPSVVASYLRGLFEADGSVTNSDTGKVSFSSSRQTLATDVHQLLLALGVPATLREQQNTGPDKKFKCWHVLVVAAGLSNFFEQIGFISERKQAKLRTLVARQTGKIIVGSMPNLQKKIRDLHLSGEVRRLLNNTASLGRPVSPQLARTIEKGYPEISRSLGLGHITGFKQLFLPVMKIEPAGELEVFDLSVPGPMTYISDGFVSHNSQIELRILADFTGDEGFINAFNSGADLHRVTAAQVFNVPLEEVTADQRSFAKRLNFGVVYGIGAQRFSMMTGLTQTEAEDLLRRYFSTYRALDTWLRDAALRALRERTARTASGRMARFNFDPADKQAASLAQRNGKNTPVQGSSADILKRALRLLHDKLRGTSACIVNMIHDEIVVEADAAQAEEISKVVEDAMCKAGEEYVKKVPVKVETEIADAWVK